MNARGFTLVEVLVVLVILGLTVTFTTLGFQRLESDRLQKQAGYLSSWLQDLSDSAVLDGAVYGAWFDADSRRLQSAYFHNYHWRAITGDGARSERFAADISLHLLGEEGWQAVQAADSRDGGEKSPAVLFLPSGLAQPESFRVQVVGQGSALIERDENGLYAWSLEQ